MLLNDELWVKAICWDCTSVYFNLQWSKDYGSRRSQTCVCVCEKFLFSDVWNPVLGSFLCLRDKLCSQNLKIWRHKYKSKLFTPITEEKKSAAKELIWIGLYNFMLCKGFPPFRKELMLKVLASNRKAFWIVDEKILQAFAYNS